MGKSLVIKGADFSANGISTLITWVAGYSDSILQGETGRVVNTDLIPKPYSSELTRLGMVGKTIKYLKLDAASAGTITIYKVNLSDNSTSQEQQYSVAAGKNIIELPSPITIGSDTYSVGTKGNGIIRYWSSSASYPARGWQGASGSNVRYPIDFGY